MLHGAAHILGPVSALHVDPFALAQAQVEGTHGYVLISPGEEDDRRTYIVIFFEGPRVRECVRLEREERSFVDISTVRTTIANAERDRTMVHLFTLDRPGIDQFLAVVPRAPCLKVQVDTLSRKQIETLVRGSGRGNMIAERNDFSLNPPIFEFQSTQQDQALPTFEMGFKQGGFLLYRSVALDSGSDPGVELDASIPEADQVAEFMRFIRDLQTEQEEPARTDHIARLPEVKRISPKRDRKLPPRKQVHKGTLSSPPPEPPLVFKAPSPKTPPLPGKPIQTDPAPEIVGVFQRLLHSFRRESMTILGSRCSSIFDESEKAIRVVSPDFNSRKLCTDTAILVLDLVDAVISSAPVLRRSKIRNIALLLITDLYNKHFDVLEQLGVLGRVEQFYFDHKR